MSFFIAFFPFDFECAKVQHFIGMAIVLEKNFYQITQLLIYQYFTHNILFGIMHWANRIASAPAEVVVDVAVIINDKLEALRIKRQARVE